MTGPSLIVIVSVENEPVIVVDAVVEGEARRLGDWLANSHVLTRAAARLLALQDLLDAADDPEAA